MRRARRRNVSGAVISVVAAIAVLALPSRAQEIPHFEFPGGAVEVSPFTAEELTSADLTAFDAEDWKQLRGDFGEMLWDSDMANRQAVLQSLIHIGLNYRDNTTMDRLTGDVYDIYLFDHSHNMRLMALATLYALHEEQSMRMLNQHVRWESSPMLRRLTHYAVVDYFVGVDKAKPSPETVAVIMRELR